jgi:PKD repeat protein
MVLALLWAVFSLPPPALAQSPLPPSCCLGSPVFGPEVFPREKAKPVNEQVPFSVGTPGPYTLCILNGDAAGNYRVSSAVIQLNGAKVVDPSAFNQQVAQVIVPVTLRASNLLEVEVRSKPGSYLTISIVGPPTLSVTTPFAGAVVTTSPLTVQGTVDPSATSVTVNGIPASLAAGTFEASGVPLVPGTNTITIVATNACGLSTTHTLTVVFQSDSTPPQVRLCMEPRDEESYHLSTWDGTAWRERGVLSYPHHYVTRQFDLTPHLPDPAGHYRVQIRQEGKEAAHIDALWIVADGVSYPPLKATHLTRNQDVLPKVSRFDHDVVDLHGQEMLVEWGAVPKAKKLLLVLRAREEDLSGRPALQPFRFPHPQAFTPSYRVILTPTHPLVIDGEMTPEDRLSGPLFVQSTFPVTGHPAGKVWGYVKSDSAYLYALLDVVPDNTQDPEKDWGALYIQTPAGEKTFRVTERDSTYGRAGFAYTPAGTHQHRVYEFQIPLSTIPATAGETISVAFGAYGTAAGGALNCQDTLINIPWVVLRGFVDDLTATVTVNGFPVPLETDGSFVRVVFLQEGVNRFTAQAVDPAGNVGTAELTVTLDTVDPTIRVTAPFPPAATIEPAVTVQGVIDDPAISMAWVTATSGVQEVPITGGRFTASVPLRSGVNWIVIEVRDAAGNWARSNTLTVARVAALTGTVTGTVTHAALQVPLAGVMVTEGNSGATTTTDKEGQYALTHLPSGLLLLSFSKAGYATQTLSLFLMGDAPLTQHVALQPLVVRGTLTVAGSIRDSQTGQPLEGVKATLQGIALSSWTGKDGTFLIQGVPFGYLTLTLEKAGYHSQTLPPVLPPWGVEVFTFLAALTPLPGTLQGTVLDQATGAPLLGMQVTVTDPVRTQTTATDAAGRYTVSGITPGAITVTFSGAGYLSKQYTATILPGGTLTLDVVMETTGSPPPPFTLSNLAISAITATAATVTWMTDQIADSRVEYGPTPAYGSVRSDPTLVKNHSMLLTGLTPSTLYHVRVSSTNGVGQTVTSPDTIFTTAPATAVGVTITSPLHGSTLQGNRVVVRGTVTGIGEVGVTVNGVPATVMGNQWVLNSVPLQPGENTLTATATDAYGATGAHTITVTATPAPGVKLDANVTNGLAPLEVRFSASWDLPQTPRGIYIDFGDGTSIAADPATFSGISHTYTTEGFHDAALTVTGADGRTYTDVLVMAVLSRTEIDALLQGKWTVLKQAMQRGDAGGALGVIASASRARYQTNFNLFASRLPQLGSDLPGSIRLLSVSEGFAECEMQAVQFGGTYSFSVQFVRDVDGIWRIRFF